MANANVFLSMMPQRRSVIDYMSDLDEADARRQRNALGALTLRQTADTLEQQQRQRARQNEIDAAYRGIAGQSGGDENKLIGLLRGSAYPELGEKAGALEKAISERRRSAAAADWDTAQAEKARSGTQADRRKEAVLRIGMAGTPDEAAAIINSEAEIPMQARAAMIQSLQQAAQTGKFDAWKLRVALGAMQAKDQAEAQMPKMVNAGGSWTNTNPLSGAPAVPITQSADNAATQATERYKAGLVDARARDRLDFDKGAGAPGDPTQAELTKRFGKAEPGRRWKADGSLEPIPGGSADQKSTVQDIGKGSVSDVVGELRTIYNQLDEAGGITNPNESAGRNLVAGVSSSNVGQATGRMFGTQNQSLRNKVAQARPLLMQAIMKATGMTARQMDSNVELKLWLSTATDPKLDVAANRAALDRIEQAFGRGGTGTVPTAPNIPGVDTGAGVPGLEQFRILRKK